MKSVRKIIIPADVDEIPPENCNKPLKESDLGKKKSSGGKNNNHPISKTEKESPTVSLKPKWISLK